MTIDPATRTEPKTTLQGMEVHSTWSRQYRSGENDEFYDLAFDYIARVLGRPDDAPVLDAGCGSGTKSFALARRGYRVEAIDFSSAILERADMEATAQGLSGRIRFSQADLTDLSFRSSSMQRIVCWGVLMHIPDLSRAIAELARVTVSGGTVIVSEGNMRSIQAVSLRWLKKLLGRERAEVSTTPAGIEFWERTDSGSLMTRQSDIPWLIAEFRRNGLHLVERRAGQFTEVYVLLRWRPLRRLVHAFNNLWFRFPRLAGPSYGNLLVFRKPV
jgi:SAM-dependent methyltransferase